MEIPQRDAAVCWSAPVFQIPAPDLSIGKSYEKRPKNMPGEGFPGPAKRDAFCRTPPPAPERPGSHEKSARNRRKSRHIRKAKSARFFIRGHIKQAYRFQARHVFIDDGFMDARSSPGRFLPKIMKSCFFRETVFAGETLPFSWAAGSIPGARGRKRQNVRAADGLFGGLPNCLPKRLRNTLRHVFHRALRRIRRNKKGSAMQTKPVFL
ncbi:MAG TPA: hypothetical protein PKY19_02530 [Oscillospiraceae bacterium]|nr:hypothetical protein [Oscillospiraceae bacterium]HXK77343.1 hypothetical protein [Oscillospiraceae bacterium]